MRPWTDPRRNPNDPNHSNNMATKVKPLADRVLVRGRRRRRDHQGWHHHSRHRQGEAPARRGRGGGQGRVAEDGKVTPLSVKAGDEILYGGTAARGTLPRWQGLP